MAPDVIKRNKFPLGYKRTFVREGWSAPIPAGAYFNVVTLDPVIGPETALFLIENREFLDQLRKQGPFELRLNAGGVNTSAGPILYTLWWFPPVINKQPFAAYELLINPEPGSQAVIFLEQISKQTHLHLVILDEEQEIFDVVEFENVYGLGRLAEVTSQIRPQLANYDFDSAKRAFMQEIPQESLF